VRVAALSLLAAAPARAATTFNWSDPSVTITQVNPFLATVTGSTIGDRILPFTVTISSVGSPFTISTSLLGADPFPLNLNLPPPRNAGTLMTVDIRLDNGIQMTSGSYTLLDVDASPGSPLFTNWRDQVTVQNAGSTLTALNPAFTQVVGLVALGFAGNAPNGSTLGNVTVSTPGTFPFVGMTYGPGPGDGFASNQRFGISNVVLVDTVNPEPETWVLIGTGLGLCLLGALRSRRATCAR
jgi:hypothetical protein